MGEVAESHGRGQDAGRDEHWGHLHNQSARSTCLTIFLEIEEGKMLERPGASFFFFDTEAARRRCSVLPFDLFPKLNQSFKANSIFCPFLALLVPYLPTQEMIDRLIWCFCVYNEWRKDTGKFMGSRYVEKTFGLVLPCCAFSG